MFSYGTKEQIAAHKAWLTADLAAVDRRVTPWLIAAGHKVCVAVGRARRRRCVVRSACCPQRPTNPNPPPPPPITRVVPQGYWEKNTDWSVFYDDLFAKHQVDLMFAGHTHNYERLRPVANEAPSDAGCLSDGDRVYTGCVGTTIIIAGSPGCDQDIGTRLAPADVLLTLEMAYGYGYLTANATALHWHWFETAAVGADGVVRAVARGAGATDEAWFFKSA